jgi:4-amino-4-deoxy-L-arabinose transferase-like glycosyltransferase
MKSRIALIALLISLLASLFWNLGNYPLSLEEPRRAFVALEMIYSGNYIVPTLMGTPYHAKPPLYEWVLVGLFKAAGAASEWMVRLPSVLALLLLAGLNYLLARKYLKKETALFGSLFILTCGGFYYYFSLIGEIDLFFSLIAWLGMASIFYFEDTGKPVALLFLVSYFFTALGFMTKGFPAIAFQGLTLVGWLIYKKKWKTLFSPWHFAGIGLFLLIVGSYFYAYHQQQSVNAYLLYLWSESSSRTILGSEAIKKLLIHLVRFPAETLAELMPWSLLLLFFTKEKAKESFKQNPLIAFCLFAFCLNYLLYWLSPGAKQRYIYALYPLILLPLAHWATEADKESAPARRFKAITLVLVTVMLLAFVAAPLSQVPKYLVYFPRYAMVVMVILWAGYLLLLKELLVKKQNPLLILLIALILAKVGMDVFYIPIKAHKGSAASAYKTATEINALSRNQPLQAWGNGYIPYGVVFYLEKERKEILTRSYDLKLGVLYLANGTEIPPATLVPLYQTQLKKDTIILLKKSEEPLQIKSLK